MFSFSLRTACGPLLVLSAVSALLAGCGGGTNLPTPGSGNGGLGDNGSGGDSGAVTLGTNSIVFVSTRDGNPEIYSINADGTGAQRLTTSDATDEQPSRSRDGSRIVFSSQRDGNPEIYSMNADGSGLVRLTNDTGPVDAAPSDQRPVFSPDGTKIVWQSTRGGVLRLWTMDASGANQTPFVFAATTQAASDGSWNPDSQRVLGFVANTNPALRDLALISRGATASDSDTFQILRPGTSGTHPRYSPDGSRIVYSDAATTGAATLQFFDASGAASTNAAPTGGANQLSPSFSPTGNRLAWSADASTNASSPQRQLYVATLGTDTTAPTGTPITTQGENYDPSWSQ